jgi:hypothetical protein
MKTVLLAMVEIDDNGRMRLYPVQEEYDFIYRAAAGVDWSKEGGFLYFREPNKLPYSMCFKQIVSAVSSEYGDVLEVEPATKWLNVPAEFQEEIMRENENRRPNQSPEPTRFARGSALNVSRNMNCTPILVRAFVFLWICGCIIMLPAMLVAAPLSSYIARLGLACICLACCLNVFSAVITQKMWGRLSVITPNTVYGGARAFYGLSALYGILAVVCAIAAFTFESKT